MAVAALVLQAQAARDPIVVFVCEHGAAKSVIAAAYFNKIAAEKGLRARAVYRGVNPQAELSERALAGLRDDGLAVPVEKPAPITQADLDRADVVFAIGCTLPKNAIASGKAASWDDVPDDKGYGATRDAIARHVEQLVDDLLKKQPRDSPQIQALRRRVVGNGILAFRWVSGPQRSSPLCC